MEWRPHPKQVQALKSLCFETLYGGARGGGKSAAGIAWLLYGIENPKYRALVIRKNAEDTKDWVDRAKEMYTPLGATFAGQPAVIEFPSGAKIYVNHLATENAYTKYQGHEYQRILIEELTQIPSEELYLRLISSCRSTVDGLKPRIFATCNPGGIGHTWVKKRFVDAAEPMSEYADAISGRKRVYIPATVDDNPTIIEKDPEYIKYLESLPPDLRSQWRYGSWENVEFKGQIFGESIRQAKTEGRIYSFYPETNKGCIAVFDIGMNDSMAITFAQNFGQQWKVFAYHESNNQKWSFYGDLLKNKVPKVETVVLPHDGTKRAGETLRSFSQFLQEEYGINVFILPRTNDVNVDIQEVKQFFPCVVFSAENTARLLECIEAYRYEWDDKNQIFKTNPKHDWTSHGVDSFRYLAMYARKHFSTDQGSSSILSGISGIYLPTQEEGSILNGVQKYERIFT